MTTKPSEDAAARSAESSAYEPALGSRLQEAFPPVVLSALLIGVALVVGVAGTESIERSYVNAAILLIVVLSTFMFSGLSGVLSFGHLSFVALGAYAGALLTIPPATKQSLFSEMPGFLSWITDVQLAFVPATIAAGLFATVIAFGLSFVIARLDGIEAAIATFAILVIVNNVLLNWDEVTRGSSSVIGVPEATTVTSVTVWAVVALFGVGAFGASRWGLSLRGSREDPIAARSLGVNIVTVRALAFTCSAFLGGAAGALYAQYNTTFAPNVFYLSLTFTTIAMLTVGGFGTLTGAFVGVALITAVTEVFQRLEESGLGPVSSFPAGTTQMVIAAVTLITLILRPGGIAEREIRWPSWARKRDTS